MMINYTIFVTEASTHTYTVGLKWQMTEEHEGGFYMSFNKDLMEHVAIARVVEAFEEFKQHKSTYQPSEYQGPYQCH